MFACVARADAQAQAPGPQSTSSPSPVAAPIPGPADCTVIGSQEISTILGYDVGPADEPSRAGGACFFASRSISHDGSASYAVVDEARLSERRAYYALLARKCAGVQVGASRYAICKSFIDLSGVKDIAAYFAARAAFPSAESVKGLGDEAAAAGDALYVKRGGAIYEVSVRHGDALDIDRTSDLAKRLLTRMPLVPAPTPEPSASPRRPKDS